MSPAKRVIYTGPAFRNFKFITPTPANFNRDATCVVCDRRAAARRPISFSKRCPTTTHQDSPGYRHDLERENLFFQEVLNCTVRVRSHHSAPISSRASAPWKIAAKRQAGRSGPPPPWSHPYSILAGTRGSAAPEERHSRSPAYSACIRQ